MPNVSPDLTDELFADAASNAGLGSRPMPSVLESDCVRTGISHQLYRGCPPRCVMAARSRAIRMIDCGLRFVGPILGSGGFQPIRYARSGGIARLA